MYYTVNDLSYILGITTNALRFFEKEQVINTKKTKNGRRYYDITDVSQILSCKKYSSMGISLKDIARQFSAEGDKKEIIYTRIQERLTDIEQKIDRYQEIAMVIEEQMESIQSIDRLIGSYEVAICPECYLLYDPDHGLISTDKEMKRIIKSWLEILPSVKQSAFFLPDKDKPMDRKASLGFCASIRLVKKYSLPIHKNSIHLPSVPCLHTIVLEQDFFDDPYTAFEKTVAFMRQRDLSISGAVWGQLILVECFNTLKPYIEIWAPFQFS